MTKMTIMTLYSYYISTNLYKRLELNINVISVIKPEMTKLNKDNNAKYKSKHSFDLLVGNSSN